VSTGEAKPYGSQCGYTLARIIAMRCYYGRDDASNLFGVGRVALN
jgi:hypothetical protein